MRARSEALPVRDSRVARELRAAFELWLLPLAVALLPYRTGIALAWLLARALPLYAAAADAGAAQWRAAGNSGDEAAWRAAYRFSQLVDHADLFWALTRSRGFLLRRMPPSRIEIPRDRPLLVLSFHYGQGLWLMHWLASLGHPARFLSIRLAPEEADGALQYAYARLRIFMVGKLAGVAPIFTGGARRAVADALAAGGAVYGLVDVPVPGAAGERGNAMLLGQSVLLPTGLIESAAGSGASVLLLTARAQPDGTRVVEAQRIEPADRLAADELARALESRIAQSAADWHFWHLWPSFHALDASRG